MKEVASSEINHFSVDSSSFSPRLVKTSGGISSILHEATETFPYINFHVLKSFEWWFSLPSVEWIKCHFLTLLNQENWVARPCYTSYFIRVMDRIHVGGRKRVMVPYRFVDTAHIT
jgi:hypothetical protein